MHNILLKTYKKDDEYQVHQVWLDEGVDMNISTLRDIVSGDLFGYGELFVTSTTSFDYFDIDDGRYVLSTPIQFHWLKGKK